MNTPAPKPARSFWPYAIIVWMTLFATGVFSYIVFAQGHKMDLVGADYYDQEIKFQQQIDRVDRTRAVERQVAVTFADGAIRIALPPEHVGQNPTGTVHLYRPSNAKLDQRLPLALDATAAQRIDAQNLLPGLWKVRIT
jgi:hypothetical protein